MLHDVVVKRLLQHVIALVKIVELCQSVFVLSGNIGNAQVGEY